MATKKTTKSPRASAGKPAAKKTSAKRPAAAKKTAKKPRKRTAVPIGKHAASRRGGRPCTTCAKLHSKRQHGSHAEGPVAQYSYKTRAAGKRKAPEAPEAPEARKRAAKKPRAKKASAT
jgi:hypothetical protein